MEPEMTQHNGREESPVSDAENPSVPHKTNLLPWKIVCMIMAALVTVGWFGIIALLFFKEEWMLVFIACLLLYSATHFCYWYCCRHNSRNLNAQIRQQLMARLSGTDINGVCEGDCPPSYDDLVKSETPPPTYYSVVDDSTKTKGASIALPWFIKRKLLSHTAKNVTGKSSSTSEISEPSTSDSRDEADSVSIDSVSSVSISMSDDDEQPIQLPSYDVLMKEATQPVFTPIHQALSKLPSLPPPYSPRPLESIVEVEQQQNE